MQTGTTSRAPLPPTRKVGPSIYAPTRRVAPSAAKPAPAARRTPTPTPAPGRRTGTPRAECPGCKALLPAGSVICVECGFCLTTGRFLRNSTIHSRLEQDAPETRVGFLKLGAGMITKPVQTMDAFLFHAGRPDLLWKVGLFAVFGILVSAFVNTLGKPGLFPAALGVQAVQFVVFVGCLLLAGMVLGERSNFLGAAVGIGFVSAIVQITAASLLFGIYVSAAAWAQHPFALILGMLAFLVWALFMHVVAIRGVFACGTVVAIGISILAGIIDWFAWKAIGETLHMAI